jgi:hypothetical protein
MSMVNYHFNDTDNILYVEVGGTITLQSMLDAIDKFTTDESLPDILNILEDSRNVNVKFSDDDLDKIRKKLIDQISRFQYVKHAVVHADPINTAIATIAENTFQLNNYYLKVFSSLKSAREWLISSNME